MRNLLERDFGALARETRETDPGVHPRKILARQPCLFGCGRTRPHD